MNNEPSFASLLVKQSPSPHFGHGWIMGINGKRWHPSRDQSGLLNDLQAKPKAHAFKRLLNMFKGSK
ncbi:phage filamentation protein Fil family protein [Siccibacter turicensis]|uniref:phage filamentation protein Fil family protein n=1 Tax=Siccibacter turicensis TaxID=357233 RepID=UPI00101F7C85|nr:phage filamentation protein Fil family protein [Siccibacter turicensis]